MSSRMASKMLTMAWSCEFVRSSDDLLDDLLEGEQVVG